MSAAECSVPLMAPDVCLTSKSPELRSAVEAATLLPTARELRKRVTSGGAHLGGMPLAVEEDIPADAADVGLLGAAADVAKAVGFPHPVEELGWVRGRAQFLYEEEPFRRSGVPHVPAGRERHSAGRIVLGANGRSVAESIPGDAPGSASAATAAEGLGGLRIIRGRALGGDDAVLDVDENLLDRPLGGKAPAPRSRRHHAHAVARGQAEAPDLRGQRALIPATGIEHDGATAAGPAPAEPPRRA